MQGFIQGRGGEGGAWNFPATPEILKLNIIIIVLSQVLINPIVHFWLHHTAHYTEKIPYSGKFWRALNLAKWLYFDIGEILIWRF